MAGEKIATPAKEAEMQTSGHAPIFGMRNAVSFLVPGLARYSRQFDFANYARTIIHITP